MCVLFHFFQSSVNLYDFSRKVRLIEGLLFVGQILEDYFVLHQLYQFENELVIKGLLLTSGKAAVN